MGSAQKDAEDIVARFLIFAWVREKLGNIERRAWKLRHINTGKNPGNLYGTTKFPAQTFPKKGVSASLETAGGGWPNSPPFWGRLR